MNNESIKTPIRGLTFTQWLASLLRHLAELLTGDRANRPTIDDVRKELAEDVELRLLEARAEAERYRHTVNMLEERLGRLRYEQSNSIALASSRAGTRPAEGVRGRSGHDGRVPVPTGRATLAEPQAEAVDGAGRSVGEVGGQGAREGTTPVVRRFAGGDQR